jgi:hypothetical protein
MKVRIDTFRFGSIEIDGKKYGKDVIIDSEGGVRKRKGGFLKFGKHNISKEEIKDLARMKGRPDILIIGLGTSSAAKLEPATEAWADKKGIELVVVPSSEAVERFNREQEVGDKKVAALIHLTC